MTTNPTEARLRGQQLAADAEGILSASLPSGRAYTSYGIPLLHHGAPAVAFFSALVTPRPDGTNEDMSPPIAELILDWATGEQVELRKLRDAAAADTEPTVPIRPLAFREPITPAVSSGLAAYRARLDAMFELVMARYTANPQRPPMDDATRYIEQFEDLVPQAVRPYYHALNPDFFDNWVYRGR
jgi:hypothetical protein